MRNSWRFGAFALALSVSLSVSGCKKDAAPAAPPAAPTADKVQWDPKGAPNDAPEWPMKAETITPSAATSFAKSPGATAGPTAPNELWSRLKPFSGSYLKAWRSQLDADPASATDVVDAFNELAIQVTGPTGFWRKTLPDQWLGCAENGETPPCQKMAAMKDELTQWDGIQKQIQELEPEKAQKFVQKNYAKLVSYLETYVPEEPSAAAMKKTPFYQKHLASVLDGMM